MKKYTLRSLLLVCFSALVHFGFSLNYYVDGVNGSDTNTGTSPSQAWGSIDKVNSVYYTPGDSVLFRRGQNWVGSIFIDQSGTSVQPIVFGAYGQGAAPGIKGSISADSSSFWSYSGNGIWETTISFVDEVSVLFYNTNDTLPLRGKKEALFSGLDDLWDFFYDPVTQKVFVYSPIDDPSVLANGLEIPVHRYGIHVADGRTHITITGLDIQYFADDGVYTHTPGAGLTIDGNNIANIGGAGSTAFHGNGVFIHFLWPNDTFKVINNDTYNIWHIGVFVPVGPTPSELYGSQINNNNLIMTGGSAIGVRFAIGVDVSDNYIEKASVYITDRTGIGLENCDHTTVYRNVITEAEDDGSSVYSGWLSSGIYTFGANHTKLYYNIVSNGKVGIHLDDDDGTYGYTSVGNEICYNLCYDHGGIGIMVEQENDSTLVYNNTSVNSLYAGLSFRGYAAENSDHCSVRNNIICNFVYSNNVVEIADIGSGFEMDNNCFHHSDPSANLVHWLGGNYLTNAFANYQMNSGHDANSMTLYPLFLDLNGWDLSLNSQSPCIDNGASLGLVQDIIGAPVPWGAGVDMGAYEYSGMSTGIGAGPAPVDTGPMLYPNPCHDELNIAVGPGSPGSLEYTVYSYTGAIVLHGKRSIGNNGPVLRLDVGGLAPGLYKVRFRSDTGPDQTRDLIKI